MARARKYDGETQAERDALRMRLYRQKNGNKGGGKTHRDTMGRPFVGIDSEAVDGRWCILAAHSGTRRVSMERGIYSRILETRGAGEISTEAFLHFLQEVSRETRGILVAYGAGYEFEMGLRDLSQDDWRRVKDTPYDPVKGVSILEGQWRIAYLPGKKLSAWKPGEERSTLFNVLPYFQTAFLPLCLPGKLQAVLATDEEIALLEWGKRARAAFRDEDWDRIIAYNNSECSLLARIMEGFRESLRPHNAIPERSWHGPGTVARKLLRSRGMAEWRQDEREWPDEVRQACNRAYFGGRNQCLQVGHFARAWGYDINSAYPAAILTLPTSRGRWQPVRGLVGDYPWAIYHVNWNVQSANGKGQQIPPCGSALRAISTLTPFPWRDKDGSIHYARAGEGWYWGPEVIAALELWGGSISILNGWMFLPTGPEKPFQWLQEFVSARNKAKAAKKEATNDEDRVRHALLERAGKLGPNSIYGVTAQKAGTAAFRSPLWAGLTTAVTRARLLRAAALDPEAVIMFATDAIYANRPLAVSVSPSLGEWDRSIDGVQLEAYQPGLYRYRKKGQRGWTERVRGIRTGSFPWRLTRFLWRKASFLAPSVACDRVWLMGHRQAYHEGHPERQGTWQRRKLEISPHPGAGYHLAVSRLGMCDLGRSVRWVQSDYEEAPGMSGRYLGWPECASLSEEYAEDTENGYEA